MKPREPLDGPKDGCGTGVGAMPGWNLDGDRVPVRA